jgi:hypothetical protein
VAATIFAANESQVLVNGKAVDGVRSLEYRVVQTRENIYGLGTNERIGMVSGAQVLEGRLRVVSTSPLLDQLGANEAFQISAVLVHDSTKMNVAFDECYLQERTFDLAVGGFGETVYAFTATRPQKESAS